MWLKLNSSETSIRLKKSIRGVIANQGFDLLIGAVDVLIAVLKGRLNGERRRVAGLRPTGVVRAGVLAESLNVGNVLNKMR
jgi:hypothetical protein